MFDLPKKDPHATRLSWTAQAKAQEKRWADLAKKYPVDQRIHCAVCRNVRIQSNMIYLVDDDLYICNKCHKTLRDEDNAKNS